MKIKLLESTSSKKGRFSNPLRNAKIGTRLIGGFMIMIVLMEIGRAHV
jgi:hypothetical protein